MTETFQTTKKIRTAVITGRHPFDVPSFHALFRGLPDIDPYIQPLEDFASDAGKVRKDYDAVVFYNFHKETPDTTEVDWWAQGIQQAIEELGDTAQGVVVLHHAILAFPEWQPWSDVCGIQGRSFGYHVGQTIRVEIADNDHPITKGLEPWEMMDETYTMDDPGKGSEPLLTADHPKSMKTIAWTRQHKNARVFCLQSGHDNDTFVDPNFREVLARGIQWVAQRL